MRPARVFLVGFAGAGKSTYGRRWARKLGVAFWDTDAWITACTGRSPAAWIQQEGEMAFRAVEREAVAKILRQAPPAIVALGGGTLTIPGVPQQLRAAGWLVWIDPPWPWLLHRLRKQPRPLLQGRPETEWHQLWLSRRPLYRLSDLHWPPHHLPEKILLLWLQRSLAR